jgi:hypothetical protein
LSSVFVTFESLSSDSRETEPRFFGLNSLIGIGY